MSVDWSECDPLLRQQGHDPHSGGNLAIVRFARDCILPCGIVSPFKGSSIRDATKDVTTGKRLLLIDDDEALCEMLAEQLHLHEEFTVDVASTAADGLERAKADLFDVILL
ncbi:MAG: response regulator, partial [Rhodospirillales bacterium]|nr:response regulator [Rhodospirillales bacterium]